MSEEKQLEFDFEFDNISDHYIVSESNALIEARTNLTLYEERLIYILASRIHPDDTKFKTHHFKVKDIAEKLNLKEKNFYTRVREIIDSLQDKKVIIEEKSMNSTLSAHWLAAARYYHGKGMIELEFSEMLRPYLLQLQKNFTKFKLWNVLYLKSFYSSKLYKLLKQYLPLQKRRFTMEQLREKLEIEEGKYEKYSHLKNRILLSAQAELEKKTDIKFTFEEIKSGAKVVGIIFNIFPNHKNEREVLNDSDYIDQEETLDLLARFEINKKTARELVKKYGEQHIRDNIKYVYDKKRNIEVSNMAGYIIRAIEENYADIKRVYDPEDEEDQLTSISQLNSRISKFIFFYDQCIKEGVETETEGMRNMMKKIMDEIQRTSEQRLLLNKRPLELDDFYHHHAKEAFKYFSAQNNGKVQALLT
ncbi:replication initiation protein [Paenibacillus vini]|uniref:replication initiation protein n=1 Tax=Paenibacillus vini TaxID=1476024 RepID=UPI0025B6460F|nr:replication initiation protein [Paenibacillus vini]MDN4067685.1 replication initiation protein [Paenibacillus vini]